MESPFARFLAAYPPMPAMTWRMNGAAAAELIQAKFGIAVPTVLRAFWSTVGAGNFAAGELYIFGDVAAALPGPELINWNSREWWRKAYPSPVEGGPFFFAQTAFGCQIGFRWEGDVAVPIQFCPDTFDDWVLAADLGTLLADPPADFEDPALLAHARKQIGKLPAGKHYVPDLSPLLGGLGESFHVESPAIHLAGAIAQYEALCEPPPEEPAPIEAMDLSDRPIGPTRQVQPALSRSLRVLEIERKIGSSNRAYTLGLTIVADDTPGLQQGLTEAKVALIDWEGKRQAAGDLIQLTFDVPRSIDSDVGSLLNELREDEEQLGPILAGRTVLVAHVNRDGSPRFEYQLDE